MPFMLAILAIIGILALAPDRAPVQTEQQRHADQSRAVATRMAYYHRRAVELCWQRTACDTGEIDMTAMMTQGGTLDLDLNFVSVADNNWVVTTWRGSAPTFSPDGRTMMGGIARGLSRVTMNSAYAGHYDAATGRIHGNPTMFVAAPSTVIASPAVPIPDLFPGGLTLQDGHPVLATRRF